MKQKMEQAIKYENNPRNENAISKDHTYSVQHPSGQLFRTRGDFP
jgi:hypothetical protein